jgi:hypothetical protein
MPAGARRRLGKYELLEELARGGRCGETSHAHQRRQSYSCSMTAARAAVTSRRRWSVTTPLRATNRSTANALTCRTSSAESLTKPFRPSGSRWTCQRWRAKLGCHSVIGTPSFIGSTPTALELMTRTSRVFFISGPRVGSRSTSQISPRRGLLISPVGQIGCFPLSPVSRLCVITDPDQGLGSENLTPLAQPQGEERLSCHHAGRLCWPRKGACGRLAPAMCSGEFAKRCSDSHSLCARMDSDEVLRKESVRGDNGDWDPSIWAIRRL